MIYCKEFVYVIMETSKCSLWRRWEAWKTRGKVQFESEGRLVTEMDLRCGRSFIFLRPTNNQMRPTNFTENNLLNSHCTNSNFFFHIWGLFIYLFIYFYFFKFSHCTARESSYPYMYTLHLHFSPPFVVLQYEYLDIVLNATQQDLLVNLF